MEASNGISPHSHPNSDIKNLGLTYSTLAIPEDEHEDVLDPERTSEDQRQDTPSQEPILEDKQQDAPTQRLPAEDESGERITKVDSKDFEKEEAYPEVEQEVSSEIKQDCGSKQKETAKDFMSLPSELRLRIYQYVFDYGTLVFNYYDENASDFMEKYCYSSPSHYTFASSPEWLSIPRNSTASALIGVCRLLHQEAFPILIRQTLFIFSIPAYAFQPGGPSVRQLSNNLHWAIENNPRSALSIFASHKPTYAQVVVRAGGMQTAGCNCLEYSRLKATLKAVEQCFTTPSLHMQIDRVVCIQYERPHQVLLYLLSGLP